MLTKLIESEIVFFFAQQLAFLFLATVYGSCCCRCTVDLGFSCRICKRQARARVGESSSGICF